MYFARKKNLIAWSRHCQSFVTCRFSWWIHPHFDCVYDDIKLMINLINILKSLVLLLLLFFFDFLVYFFFLFDIEYEIAAGRGSERI